MKQKFLNYKNNFLKQVERDRQTDYKKKFKNRFFIDWTCFWRALNIFRYFTSVRRGVCVTILGALFPYLIIFWCGIWIYEALFIYLFMFLDFIVFRGLKNWLKLHIVYVLCRNFLFFIFYKPIFFYFPKFVQWLRYIFSIQCWLFQIGRIVSFFFNIFLFFYVRLVNLIAWLDNYEENYALWKAERATKKQLHIMQK